MRRIVLGGFGSSPQLMNRLAERLSTHHDKEYEGIAFRPGMADRDLDRKLKDAEVETHSAGMVAAMRGRPRRITAYAPPVPRGAFYLATRAIKGNIAPVADGERQRIADEILRGAVGELALHLAGNLGRLKAISRFNAFEAAKVARERGTYTQIVSMDDDCFFQLSPMERDTADQLGVPLTILEGGHDEYLYDPVAMHIAASAAFGEQDGITGEESSVVQAAEKHRPVVLGRAAALRVARPKTSQALFAKLQ